MALITKILEATLTAGSTAVVFTDTDIPNSLLRVFSSNSDLIPTSRILSGNSLTVTYPAQVNNIDIALEITKAGIEIVDNLTSTDTDKALSAKQGKVLKDAIDTTDGNLSALADTVPHDITDLDDVVLTSPTEGQVLSIDSEGNIINRTPSEGINYSLSEQDIGLKWVDQKAIYQKTVDCGNLPNAATKNVTHGISNLDTVINAFGFAKTTTNQTPIPFVNNTSVGSQVALIIDATNITLRTGDNRSGYTCYVTLQYTKTS